MYSMQHTRMRVTYTDDGRRHVINVLNTLEEPHHKTPSRYDTIQSDKHMAHKMGR